MQKFMVWIIICGVGTFVYTFRSKFRMSILCVYLPFRFPVIPNIMFLMAFFPCLFAPKTLSGSVFCVWLMALNKVHHNSDFFQSHLKTSIDAETSTHSHRTWIARLDGI